MTMLKRTAKTWSGDEKAGHEVKVQADRVEQAV
jgi:hypothetical protein